METMLEQLPYEPPEVPPVSEVPPPEPSEEQEPELTETVLSPPEATGDKPEDSKTESS